MYQNGRESLVALPSYCVWASVPARDDLGRTEDVSSRRRASRWNWNMDFVVLAEITDTKSFLRRLGESQTAQEAAQPLLSPTAEAELHLLATNFLLYVAMVIITIMVAKIYFPESLQRNPQSARMGRSFSYRVAEEQLNEYYGSDAEESDEDGFNDEVLDSDGEEYDTPVSRGAQQAQDRQRLNFLEFHQESLTKAQVLKRLIGVAFLLNLTFVIWGVLQERMLTRRYPRYTGEYFTYSYALVFTNRFWTLIMSAMLLYYLKPRLSKSTVIYEYSFPAISNMLSSWCQYEALRYISFPAQTLFKSFKLAPVMLMGKLLGNKSCKYR